MVIKLTEADRKQVSDLVESLFLAVQRNEVSSSNARDALVRAITAAAIADAKEFYQWLDPEHIRRWKRELRAE
jgi:Holliday junction resolvasome RuvABC endonuclease subunit